MRADHAVQGVFASCYVPLWAGVAAAESEQATRCLNSLQASGELPMRKASLGGICLWTPQCTCPNPSQLKGLNICCLAAGKTR